MKTFNCVGTAPSFLRPHLWQYWCRLRRLAYVILVQNLILHSKRRDGFFPSIPNLGNRIRGSARFLYLTLMATLAAAAAVAKVFVALNSSDDGDC